MSCMAPAADLFQHITRGKRLRLTTNISGVRGCSFGSFRFSNFRNVTEFWQNEFYWTSIRGIVRLFGHAFAKTSPGIEVAFLRDCQRSFNWQSTAFVMRGLWVRLPSLAL